MAKKPSKPAKPKKPKKPAPDSKKTMFARKAK